MNKLNLFAAVAITAGSFMAAAPVSAQTIGFKLGPTWSTVDADGPDTDDPKNLQSLGGGGFMRFGLMGIGMQAELLAVSKGYEIEADEDFQFKAEYIEVPILARFGLGTGAFAPYVMAGPSFGFNYSCDQTSVANVSTDCGDSVKSLDIGVTGVAGLEFGVGPGSLLVEGRYTHGLSNIFESDLSRDAKNRSYGVMAGYAITLTR